MTPRITFSTLNGSFALEAPNSARITGRSRLSVPSTGRLLLKPRSSSICGLVSVIFQYPQRVVCS